MGSSRQISRWTSLNASSSSSKRAVNRVTVASLTAQAVADLVGGRLLGDGSVCIRGIRPLDRAAPDMLSFATSSRYAAELTSSKAGAVRGLQAVPQRPARPRTTVGAPHPYSAPGRVIHELFPERTFPPG